MLQGLTGKPINENLLLAFRLGRICGLWETGLPGAGTVGPAWSWTGVKKIGAPGNLSFHGVEFFSGARRMRAPLYRGGRTKGTPVSQSVHPSRDARRTSQMEGGRTYGGLFWSAGQFLKGCRGPQLPSPKGGQVINGCAKLGPGHFHFQFPKGQFIQGVLSTFQIG